MSGVDCDYMFLGAILVFLPSYDEIMTLRDRIQEDKRFTDSNRFGIWYHLDSYQANLYKTSLSIITSKKTTGCLSLCKEPKKLTI